MLKVNSKPGLDPQEVIDDLATALDLANFFLSNKMPMDGTLKGMISDALDMCVEVEE